MTPASQQKGPNELSSLGGGGAQVHCRVWDGGVGCRKDTVSFVLTVVVWVQPSTGPAAKSYTELGLGQALGG